MVKVVFPIRMASNTKGYSKKVPLVDSALLRLQIALDIMKENGSTVRKKENASSG